MRLVPLLLIIALETCVAGARHFTYLYEAPTAAPGSWELENYATGIFNDHDRSGQFRHELEIGITEHLQAAIYLANWSYDEGAAHYDSASFELIHNLSNPAADLLGISLYQEFSAGEELFESETKLIAQKNFGPLILLYNFTVEAEWEADEQAGELQQAFGASYEWTPRFSAGVEMLHEVVLPEWRRGAGDTNVFLGPNISYRTNAWFVALTGLKQLTSTQGEPDYQVRLILGFGL